MNIKSIVEEGKQARIKAEVDFAVNNVPVKVQCVYRRFDKRKYYLHGWNSVSEIDLNVAIQCATGQLSNARVCFSQVREQLKGKICFG